MLLHASRTRSEIGARRHESSYLAAMPCLDDIKKAAMTAMKARDTLASNLLRLAAAEIQAIEGRTGKAPTEEEAHAVLRKLIKSNEETRQATTDAETRATLEKENAILQGFLPRSASVEEIVSMLAPVADAIRQAASDGQATGVAMKHLKQAGATVQGADVTRAVASLRQA
jgi:uncharacterized protein YqeY